MAYVRLVHPDHFDSVRGEFNDLAFRKSSDGGMSIFERACAEATSGVICTHIHQFYPNVVGVPVVFCFLEAADLPPAAIITPTLSDTGDECHREVDGVGNGALKNKLRPKRAWANFKVCENGVWRDMTANDAAALAARNSR